VQVTSRRISAALVALALGTLAAPGASSPAEPAPVAIVVRLTEARTILSSAVAPVGAVRFTVRNEGRTPQSFTVTDAGTRVLRPGESQTLTVRFARRGTYRIVCTLLGSTRLTRTSTITVGARRSEPSAAFTPRPERALGGLRLGHVGDFTSPTDIDAPPEDEHRLVVVEQGGLVHLLVDGERRTEPFLDLRESVRSDGEAGLLSIEFAPDYAASGLAYVFYNDTAQNLRLVEYRRSESDPDRLDPASARQLLYIVKFAPNHNGGDLQFHPDGSLYLAVGDGGSGPDVKPGQYAQSPTGVFGKLLRIDVATGTYEIAALGLRNPWRFWIDRDSGRTYVADVGHDEREEVNVLPVLGANFGWPCYEGTLRFDETMTCADSVAPVHEYSHGPGACAITGGVVSRDPRLPQLEAAYLFADLCGATIRALRVGGRRATVRKLAPKVENATTFGVDALERVYVASARGGVYRIDPDWEKVTRPRPVAVAR
jgi:glucose/arabinose dehydrogenase